MDIRFVSTSTCLLQSEDWPQELTAYRTLMQAWCDNSFLRLGEKLTHDSRLRSPSKEVNRPEPPLFITHKGVLYGLKSFANIHQTSGISVPENNPLEYDILPKILESVLDLASGRKSLGCEVLCLRMAFYVT